jgi:ADP-ribosylglycohydrolase
MKGAIIGDICGSIYEFDNRKTDHPEEIDLLNSACFYTDDSVLTCAIAEALISGTLNYEAAILKWAKNYPKEDYGHSFRRWFASAKPEPYNSFGNGSAMRVSSVGWAFPTLEETLCEAAKSAECTHNHTEGIKGARATAAAIFLARNGYEKAEIKKYIESQFGYKLDRPLSEIRRTYQFDESCQGTVPEAVTAFLESRDFARALQCAVSIGGDTDTLAAITGGIAEAYYDEIPQDLVDFMWEKINSDMQAVIGTFRQKIRWALEDGRNYTLEELSGKIGLRSKPSYKRRQRGSGNDYR